MSKGIRIVSQRVTEFPGRWEIKHMHKQWLPVSLSPPHREPQHEAIVICTILYIYVAKHVGLGRKFGG